MAATGEWYNSDIVCYENGRLIPQWQNSYTMKVIETGKPVVAIDTKEFVFAFPNMRKSVDSRFYSVLAYPIKMRGELEGVIVIASFDEEQHKIIVECGSTGRNHEEIRCGYPASVGDKCRLPGRLQYVG